MTKPDAGLADEQVVIIGAGAAGLATAACLLRRGIRPVLLDRGATVGQSWAERYDRLHLHTPRIQSHLPGHRLPARAGRWVAHDDYARYLQDYATHHGINVTFGVKVTSVRPVAGGHRLTGTNAGSGGTGSDASLDTGLDITASHVILATGLNSEPVIPVWPGSDSFPGELLHATAYRNGAAYEGRDVLVVGTGNSGAEIAADLAESGAGQIWLAVRTPPHVIPRQLGPVPTTLLGILQSFLPPAWADPVNRRLARATVGDLTRYGFPTPEEGLSARMRRRGVVPTIDVGLVAQLRLGRITVVPAVRAFHGSDVELADGRSLRPNAVIAATGYLNGAAGLLDSAGPQPFRGVFADRPGLYAVGLTQSQKGLLFQINLDARRVARTIARARPASASHKTLRWCH